MKFWDFYRIIRRRRWLIGGLVVATLISTLLATTNRQTMYHATATIMPSAAALSRPIVPGQPGSPVQDGGGGGGNQIANLMALVTSRAVAERVINALQLSATPDDLRWRVSVSLAPDPTGGGRERGRGTDIIQITAMDTDPDTSVNVANATATVFAGFYQEITHQAAVETMEFLQEELVTVERNLDEASSRLQAFKEAKGISSVAEQSSSAVGAMRNMQTQREQTAAELAQVSATLARINEQIKSIPPTRTEIRGTTDSPGVQDLERRVAALRNDLTDARARYTDAHPRVQDLGEELLETSRQLDDEKTKIRTTTTVVPNPIYEELQAQRVRLQSQREGLVARVGELSSAVGRVGAAPSPGVEVQLNRLTQEYADAQGAYSAVKGRLAAARLDEKDTTDTGAIRLVDRAYAATMVVGRSRSSIMMLGFVFSLIFGVGLAVGLEYLDNRIKSGHDVEELLSLPVTTLIPSVERRGAQALPRITYIDPLSPLAEAYRFLRTDLLLTAAEIGARAFMIATAKPGQGGTTTAANLAISFAMDGKRVVLVDADLRRPCLHGIFKVTNEVGLSSVLTGERDLDEVMVSTEITNLVLIPGGPTTLNPSELLGSRRMGDIVEHLKAEADFVIFDTPAAIAFTDTVVLAKWLDGAVLVVRANQVPRGAELQVRQLFNKANVRILSVVLNDVQPTSVDSYYYHSHYYPTSTPTQQGLLGLRSARELPAPNQEDEEEEEMPKSRV